MSSHLYKCLNITCDIRCKTVKWDKFRKWQVALLDLKILYINYLTEIVGPTGYVNCSDGRAYELQCSVKTWLSTIEIVFAYVFRVSH